ncbi:hypothetical protein [Halodesulfovibrio sp. MK-HDV]|uniref:hypothetical protein n=1 Tax=Halodesulfovibrio sp. MK-HDV TaxID=2599925 RepID=UPI0013712A1E|nr:hypothetical protein [Halodesulfovibrio sp. MK-HDV]KAF1077634.1 hypothetical protein MKHDV_00090 [Halodesulfovibrio sp. MK-HDV]
MTMKLTDLIKEVETAAAEATCGEIHCSSEGNMYVACFSVTANLDDDGNVSSGLGGKYAATVQFNVMKVLEQARS